MRSKKCILGFALIIVFSALINISDLEYQNNDTDCQTSENTNKSEISDIDLLRKLAELEKQYNDISLTQNNDKTQSSENDIIINRYELEYYENRALIMGANSEKDAHESSLQYLIKRTVLYKAAVEKGFEANFEEVTESIRKQSDVFENAESSEQFDMYLSFLGQSKEEYWNSQRNTLKIDLTIYNYLSSIKRKIAEDNNLNYYDLNYIGISADEKSQDYIEYKKLEDLWQEYYENLVNKLIEGKNIIITE